MRVLSSAAFSLAVLLATTTTLPSTTSQSSSSSILRFADAFETPAAPHLQRQRPATTEVKADLPDPNKAKDRRELRCSACRATAKAVADESRRIVDTQRNGLAMTDLDWEDMMDGICQRVVSKRNGLLMRENKPTTTYGDVPSIHVITGSWVTAFLEDECAAAIEMHEDKLRKAYLSIGHPEELQGLMCQSWKSPKKPLCTEEDTNLHRNNLTPILQEMETDRGAAEFYEREKKKARAKAAKEKQKQKTPENMVPRKDEGDL